ncbi:Uncharacterized protein Rs2_15821 [Raphanus sativus]|nr:Uncharacterized protein Rs2_15821 [Raphanus sativus]
MEAETLKQRQIQILEKRQRWSQYPFRTIQEMRRCDKCGNCRVICSVYAIDTMTGWYKLDLLVQDQTGEFRFTLLDSVATSIVKTLDAKIVNALSAEVEIPEILPPQLVEIVGKTYGFGISIDSSKSSEIENFCASKVWTLSDVIWKRTKTLHQDSTPSRKKQCTNVIKIEKLEDGEIAEDKSG